jgi:hypothetical protein
VVCINYCVPKICTEKKNVVDLLDFPVGRYEEKKEKKKEKENKNGEKEDKNEEKKE